MTVQERLGQLRNLWRSADSIQEDFPESEDVSKRITAALRAPPTELTLAPILKREVIDLTFRVPQGIDLIAMGLLPRTWLCNYHILPPEDNYRSRIKKMLMGQSRYPTVQVERGMGSLLGLIAGDALGGPLEFTPYNPKRRVLTGFDNSYPTRSFSVNKFDLKPGQWTDDGSMALCLADSLLVGLKHHALWKSPPENVFDPTDLKMRFLNWWHYGYNNAFGSDASRYMGRRSIGLGGSVGEAFKEFIRSRGEMSYARVGDYYTSGNGSLMRLAPVALLYHRDVKLAMRIAYKQSKTTHQGEEAAECCRLLAYILVTAINDTVDDTGADRKNRILKTVPGDFESPLHSVSSLASSQQENKQYCATRGMLPKDRDWRWRSKEYKYAKSRATAQPGYVGSYSMDCLTMALHCVWSTNSLEEALLKAANLGGDADTVAAVTGQIAGAIYGASAIPRPWLKAVHQWNPNADIALRAYRLVRGLAPDRISNK
jgi:ADP-ribosyl-[dinitrogen reductase] hydrolase